MKKILSTMLVAAALFLAAPSVRADEGEVLAKLNKLQDNQEKMLQMLEELKNEVQIVKVRATSR